MNRNSPANDAPSERTILVWQTCDELASEGSKPSMRLVRARGKMKGSDADIQADVNAWFSHLFEQFTLSKQADPVPDALKKAMMKLWSVAIHEAEKTFDSQRNQLQKDIADLKESLVENQDALSSATAAISELEDRLSAVRKDGDRLREENKELRNSVLVLADENQSLSIAIERDQNRHLNELAELRAESTAREERQRQSFEDAIAEIKAANHLHCEDLKAQISAKEKECQQRVTAAANESRMRILESQAEVQSAQLSLENSLRTQSIMERNNLELLSENTQLKLKINEQSENIKIVESRIRKLKEFSTRAAKRTLLRNPT